MASDPPSLPPGTGASRPEIDGFDRGDHMRGWSIAVQHALNNIGRAPGPYHVQVDLSAVVEIHNPGNVVEYIAKLI